MVQGLLRNSEGLRIGPPQILFGEAYLFLAQRLPVGRGGARLVGTPVADDGPADYQAGATLLPLGHAYCRVHTLGIHPVNGTDDVPAVGLEPLGHVLGEGDVGVAFYRYVVVVVQVDQFAQAQRARQGGRLRGDSLLQVAVGDDDVGVVVDNFVFGSVVMVGQPPLGHGHPYPVSKPLAQGAGGHFHAGGQAVLWVARCLAAPLSEALQLLQGQVVAGEVKESIQHRRGVARRQDEPVPVRPLGVVGIVLQESVPQHVGHRRRAHGSSRVAGVGLLYRVHRQEPHGVDAKLIKASTGLSPGLRVGHVHLLRREPRRFL